MSNQILTQFAAVTAAIVAIPGIGFAGPVARESKQVVEQIKESCISGDIGLDITSNYVFHGIVQENQGVILQPYADWSFKVYQAEGFLNQVSLNFGVWNSFHSRHTSTASTTRSWYEFDFLAGASFTFAKNFVFTPTYVLYASPNDSFTESHNLQLKLSYNDSDLLGAFALNPYVLAEIELDGKAGNGSDEGVYYEVGIAPSREFGPVTVAIPLKAGFGASDYYAGNKGFGFFSAGVVASYQLAFIPECLGDWSVNANATYYEVGDCCDDANSVRGDEGTDTWSFGGGVRVDF